MLTIENIRYTVKGVERGGVEIQPQNKLYPDKIHISIFLGNIYFWVIFFWENSEIW